MLLKHTHLKNYVKRNTTNSVRKRAELIEIETIEISEDQKEVKAAVLGSYGNTYKVLIKNLDSENITGSCTCPYDWGPVCKHEVAVAFEVDLLLSENIQTQKELKKKFSKTASITIPLPDKKENLHSILRRHTTQKVILKYQNWYDREQIRAVAPYTIDDTLFDFEFWEYRYSQERSYKIQVRKNRDNLELSCNCNATNQYLCLHQIVAIDFLYRELQPIFWNSEDVNASKKELLKEYGYDISENIYQQYFTFGYDQGQINIIPIQPGILKLAKYQDEIKEIVNELVVGEQVVLDALPTQKALNRPPKMTVAVGMFFNENPNSRTMKLFPLKGNIKKNGELSNQIFEIRVKEYYKNKSVFTANESKLIETLLEYAELFDNANHQDESYFLKSAISLLKKQTIDFSNFLLYEIDYYGMSYYHTQKFSARDLSKKESFNTDIPPVLHFEVTEEKDFIKIQALARVEETSYPLQHENIQFKSPFLENRGRLYLLRTVGEVKAFETFKANPELRVPKAEFSTYYTNLLKPLSEKFEVDMQHLPTKIKTVSEDQLSKQLYLSEIHGFILLKPIVQYGDEQVSILNLASVQQLKKDHVEVLYRFEGFEQKFRQLLYDLHPEFQNQSQDFFHLTPEQFIDNMWFLEAFEALKEQKVQVFGYNELSVKKYNLHKPSISMNIGSGIDWFDIEISVAYGDLNVSLKDLQKSIINKSKYIALGDGSIGILPEQWLEKYAHLFRTGTVKKDSVRISKYQFSVIDSLYDELDQDSPILEKHHEIKERLQQFDQISQVKKPRGIKATLRDYQKEGLNWLHFLNEYNFGGCLADDMGLGKTLQVITLLQYVNTTFKPTQAHLVVVPTSLIFNWQEEIKKFCPGLKVVVHTGTDREKDTKAFKPKTIVLTTYGIVLRDIELLRTYDFHYIVLDESQAIKNPNSQRYKAVRVLKAKNRLVLTGTPIENNTFDLYAQMSFANPGLLGTIAHFKKAFSTPIDKDKNLEVARELRQLIHPFLLRRTKEQVAKELPEKTEQILYCTMSESQQEVYDAYRNKYRNYLLGKMDEEGLGKSKMYVLEGLTKLRQICDAPQLLNEDETYTHESVKIKELLQHITEKTGRHKILIFSQFVSMLKLLKTELDKKEIKYEYLDGKTKDRQQRVMHFQENEDIRLFLISLKAGGTGLNLTAADYVYLVDPWWNPAVEAQAIDRCYRIGQTKHVMAYKLVCKNTIEEKIIKYQDRKKQLSEDIIQTEESFVKSLSKENIVELFS